MSDQKFSSIDEYINLFPEDVKVKLEEIYSIIKEAAPEATEKISWQMPTFCLNGNLVHFAGFKKHIGFYPGSSGVENFEEKLEGYKTSKGAIQFTLDKQLPKELIREIVAFRIKEQG